MIALLLPCALAAPPEHVYRALGGTSFMVADKDGVPDANRLFVATGFALTTLGQTTVWVEPAFAIGYSEGDRWSYRAGANVEAEWQPSAHTRLHGSIGLHWFRSRTDPEIRRGLLTRAALGFRLTTSQSERSEAFVGFEPFAIERFPDGEGVLTPLRSRWGVEVTFISAGVRL
ncbi:MAG: hypothetical protein AAF602_04150 [Myxococcota bacterium]